MNPEEARRNLPDDHAWRDAENNLAVALLEQFMQRPGLSDPGLQYWISPASQSSGDMVAAATAPDGRFYVLLADATGHGIAAAISMLPLLSQFYASAGAGAPLVQIIRRANTRLCAELSVDRFVAATFVCIDPRGGGGELWLGGMPAALVVDPDGSVVCTHGASNLPLGIAAGDPHDVVVERLGGYPPGAQLVLFSDGLVEAQNAAGAPFGMQRLRAALDGTPAASRLDAVKDAVNLHLGESQSHDDISLLLIDLPAGRRD